MEAAPSTQPSLDQAGHSSSARAFFVAWAAYALLLIAVAWLFWLRSGLAQHMDFRGMYAAGVLARTDPAHIYDLASQKRVEDALISPEPAPLPFAHAPYETLLFIPLGLLSYRHAYLAMLAANLLLLIPCFRVAWREFSILFAPWQPRAGLAIFAFLPVAISLAHGQDSILMLLIFCATWQQLARERRFTAGFVLALALFKPHLALLIGVVLAVRFGWRFVAGLAAGSAVVAALSAVLVGGEGIRLLMGIFRSFTLAGGHNQAQQAAVGIFPVSMPNLRGMLFALFGKVLSAHAFTVIVIAISIVLLIAAAWAARRLAPFAACTLAVLMAVLLSYHFEASDLVILLLPLMLLGPRPSRVLEWSRHALFGLPVVLLLVSPSGDQPALFCLMAVPLVVAAGYLICSGWSETWHFV